MFSLFEMVKKTVALAALQRSRNPHADLSGVGGAILGAMLKLKSK